MSTKCAYRVDGKTHSYTDAATGKVTKSTDKRPCGKNIAIFLRVDYSELHPFRVREGRYFDVFGFCPDHGEQLSKGPMAWKVDETYHSVRNLRGKIKFISLVDPSEVPNPKEMAKAEDKTRLMVSVKSDLKRIMGQRNTEKLTADDWRTIFGDCIDEFILEEVMES